MVYVGSGPGEVAVSHIALRALLGELFARVERYRWRCQPAHVAHTDHGVLVVADTVLTVERTAEDTDAFADVPWLSFPYRVTGLLESTPNGWRWRLCQGAEPATT